MKREFYYWLSQLAFNMVLHHDKKLKKWVKKYEESLEKYYTGGSGNADTN